MSDEFALFLILALIYGTDCFLWVGRHSIAFVSWTGNKWKEKAPSQSIRTSKGGIMLLNPFPPLGKIMCCHLPPLSIAPDGICSLNCQTLTGEGVPEKEIVSIPFRKISNIAIDDNDLFVNKELFCRFARRVQAERAGELLISLQDIPEKTRETLIGDYWRKQFDYRAAKERYENIRRPLIYLNILCNILFVYLFIISPVIILYLRMIDMLIPLAVGMIALALPIIVQFYNLHKKTYPKEREHRIINMIKMILCPPVSIRAGDHITENLLGCYNPVVVGRLLLSKAKYRDYAAQTLRNLLHPPVDFSSNREAEKIFTWQSQTLLQISVNHMQKDAQIQEDFLAPPAPDDPDNQAYCPRCLCQFVQEEGECPDCNGVKLQPFDKDVRAA